MSDNIVHYRPDFNELDYSQIEPGLDALLTAYREKIADLEKLESVSWETLMLPQELLDNELERFWSPVSHLNSVMNSDELRKVYNQCLPRISAFSSELKQNSHLYRKTLSLREGKEYASLSAAQKKIIDNMIRDFELGGVSLAPEQQQRFKEITLSLSKLTTRFSENVLDVTNSWEYLITNEARLAGLPDHAIAAAKKRSTDKGKQGWLLNLEFPVYHAVMTFADDTDLRKTFYTAYSTRASDQGPHDKEKDNSDVIVEILKLRAEKASLLGLKNFAELSVIPKMVSTPGQVTEFLRELAARSKGIAEKEFSELALFAKEQFGISKLQPWDINYYADKLKQHKFSISEDDLKPYFPAKQAIDGLFSVVGKLFGLTVSSVEGVPVWHPDVSYYEIRDSNDTLRGGFYFDLYARENKRGGAWMDVCVPRQRLLAENGGRIQLPVAYLTCNLTPPVGDEPALFTHQEVTTLFHEFGHGLHHMLTQVDHGGVSGISGVEWDAVELPSQFLENWCWERESMNMISRHYQTGEPLPEDLLEAAQAARNFHSAMGMVRQLEFSLFDMLLHQRTDIQKITDVQELLDQVRSEVSVVPVPAFNRFQHGFSHIFAGGYAAGYFSYKWAEVLSADAFSRFEEEGIFNETAGKDFLENILEVGGTREAMENFVAFRGREPDITALLRHSGLV